MELKKEIFRAYDIRGVVGEDIDTDSAMAIGYAFARFLSEVNPTKELHIAVGRDNRPSGKELSEAFCKGAEYVGVRVFDLGESPSPFLYYTVCEGAFDGGCNITASHNPSEYNGFKLVATNAHSICGETLQKDIYEIAQQAPLNEIKNYQDFQDEKIDTEDYIEKYYETMQNLVPLNKKLKIVIDSAGGVATGFYAKAFEEAGMEVIELYPEADGTFPYHSPDPLVENNLMELKAKVFTENADLGLAFDGDGDRVFAVTSSGRFIDANQMLALLAEEILQPTQHLVYTVSCSSLIATHCDNLEIKTVMTPVGHSFVENKMSEIGANLGGEQSGHFFVAKDYYSFDDALLAGFYIASIASKRSLDDAVDSLPKTVSPPERRLKCADNVKFEIIKNITQEFLDLNYECITLDGVRAEMGNGAWVGVRASNTSPCISVICEAKDSQDLVRIEAAINDILDKYPEVGKK